MTEAVILRRPEGAENWHIQKTVHFTNRGLRPYIEVTLGNGGHVVYLTHGTHPHQLTVYPDKPLNLEGSYVLAPDGGQDHFYEREIDGVTYRIFHSVHDHLIP